MAEKVMVCDDCGKMFRISYEVTTEGELKCPSCNGVNVVSIYKKINVKEK